MTTPTTQTSGFKDVLAFHEKFEVPLASQPSFLDAEAYNFRVRFLKEELDEFVDANYHNDMVKAFDSLIDLVYVAYGTAQMMGCTPEMWQEMWNAVQNANMSKVRATTAGESKRGTSLDVVKPANWQSPEPVIEACIAKNTKH